jgi:hypothetical protein
MNPVNRYPYGVPAGTCFIKVIGEDGMFYDLTTVSDSKKHIAMLTNEGYDADIVPPRVVPSCTLRDFTDGLNSYTEVSFRGGGNFYHGGKREGAGRKSTGRKKQNIYVTDDEFAKIKAFIEELRSAE